MWACCLGEPHPPPKPDTPPHCGGGVGSSAALLRANARSGPAKWVPAYGSKRVASTNVHAARSLVSASDAPALHATEAVGSRRNARKKRKSRDGRNRSSPHQSMGKHGR